MAKRTRQESARPCRKSRTEEGRNDSKCHVPAKQRRQIPNSLARNVGFEPTTFGFGGGDQQLAGADSACDCVVNHGVADQSVSTPSPVLAPFRPEFVVGLWSGSSPAELVQPMPPILPERLLTVKQVAAQLQLSTATVYAMVEAGTLACVRVRNFIRIPPEAVARLLSHGGRG